MASASAATMQMVPSTPPAPPSPPPPPTPPPLPPVYAAPSFPPVSDSKRKGLRHFAVRVCKKVEQKGQTTYNEVADELVAEERTYRARAASSANSSANHSSMSFLSDAASPLVDEKNIRRRVYDSLNVLMAMQIIGKDKKLISWQGLDMARNVPPVGADAELVKEMVEEKRRVVSGKMDELRRLRDQYQRVNALIVKRQAEQGVFNAQVPDLSSPHLPTLNPVVDEGPRVSLPFILIRAPHDAEIKLTMDEAREEVNFSFSSTFALFDHQQILSRLPLLPELSLCHDDVDVT